MTSVSTHKFVSILAFSVVLMGAGMFMAGCTSSEQMHWEENGAYRLVFNPEPGSSFHVNLDQDMQMHMHVMGQQVQQNQHWDWQSTYRIGSFDDGDPIPVEITHERVQGSMDGMQQQLEYDSEDEASFPDEIRPILGMVGQPYTAYIEPDGQVNRLEGVETLTGRMREIAEDSPIPAQQVNMILERMQNDILQGMEEVFGFQNNRVVSPGESWQIQQSRSGMVPMNLQTTYTLEQVDGTTADVVFEGTVEMDRDADELDAMMPMPGASVVEGEMEGDLSGTILVDLQTGLPDRIRINMATEGVMEIDQPAGQMQIDMNMDLQSYVTVEELE